MMLLNFLGTFCLVRADVIRDDGYHDYEGQFIVMHKGRMLRVLMYFNHVQQEECALHCVRHLRCKTINYHPEKKACELTDEDFDAIDADTISSGWYNHGTPPKVDGRWSSWRNFTDCTKTCGNGTLEQWRDCDSPKPEYGGTDCKGRMRRTVKCNTHKCPVNGGWSSWSNFTDCTKTCGDGTLEQKRGCDSPKPEYGGTDCEGRMRRTVKCNTHECPVVNVALKKEATQSSTLIHNNIVYPPSRAVDGNLRTVAITAWGTNPWWEVDMGEVRVIRNMKLNAFVNKYDNIGLIVETRRNKDESWIICKNLGDVKTVTVFTCDEQSTIAQFLRIRSTKVCRLNIYEVMIFGY